MVRRGYGHYEVYLEPAFGEVMREALAWYRPYFAAHDDHPSRAEATMRRGRGPVAGAIDRRVKWVVTHVPLISGHRNAGRPAPRRFHRLGAGADHLAIQSN